MSNIVKFKINGLSSALSNAYTRVTDLSRVELFEGETLVSDAAGNVELNIGSSGTNGQGVIVYGDNYLIGNEATFKSFSGYGVVEELFPISLMYMAASDSYVNNGSTTAQSSLFKLELEEEYESVRVFTFARQACDGWKCAIAPTETMDNSTNDNRYKPISGGVVDSGLWRTALMPAITSGSDAAPAVTYSEWMDVDSIPRSDSGSKPALLVRIFGTTSGSYQKVNVNSVWATAASETFYKQLSSHSEASDTVSSPASSQPSVVYNNGWSHWFGIEYKPKRKVRYVYAVGDSITSGGGGNVYGYDNWSNIAVFELSKSGIPITVVNGGMSGKNSIAYVNQFLKIVASGARPTDVLVPAFTPNDGNASQANCDARFALYQPLFDKCAEIGAKVWLWTGLPIDGYGDTQWIAYSNNWATAKAESDGFGLIDFNAIASDGANPMRFKPGLARPDGIHPSTALIRLMADELKSKLTE